MSTETRQLYGVNETDIEEPVSSDDLLSGKEIETDALAQLINEDHVSRISELIIAHAELNGVICEDESAELWTTNGSNLFIHRSDPYTVNLYLDGISVCTLIAWDEDVQLDIHESNLWPQVLDMLEHDGDVL